VPRAFTRNHGRSVLRHFRPHLRTYLAGGFADKFLRIFSIEIVRMDRGRNRQIREFAAKGGSGLIASVARLALLTTLDRKTRANEAQAKSERFFESVYTPEIRRIAKISLEITRDYRAGCMVSWTIDGIGAAVCHRQWVAKRKCLSWMTIRAVVSCLS
jgi:hypothetical protein